MSAPSNEKSPQNDILIVGAGLAGLTLALALAKAGVKSTVLEKHESIGPSRWTILLYPMAMKIFDELGVLEDVSKLGMRLKGPEIDAGEEALARFDAGLVSEPRLNYWLLVGPSEIRKILRERTLSQGVELLEGAKFNDVLRDPTGRITGATIENAGREFSVSSRALVGADGHNSRVRKSFVSRVTEESYPAVVGFFLDFDHGLDRMKMILGDGSQMVVLPNTQTRLNIGYTEKGLSSDVLSTESKLAHLKSRMISSAPFLKDAIEEGVKAEASGALLIEPRAIHVEPWVVDGGVLIGDAAHSFHPGTGMGAQQAFVDASVLSSVLVDCTRTGNFGLDVLRKFEAQRRPFMDVLESTNRRNISMQLAKGRFGIWMRNKAFRAADKLMEKKAFQEIFTGGRAPSTSENLRIMMALLT